MFVESLYSILEVRKRCNWQFIYLPISYAQNFSVHFHEIESACVGVIVWKMIVRTHYMILHLIRFREKNMGYTVYDFVGNVGVFLLLLVYLLLLLNKISSNQLSYSLLNGLGAMLIIVSLTVEFNLSAFAIEFFWILISAVGVVSYFRSKKEVLVKESTY